MRTKATCRSNYYHGHYLVSAYDAHDNLVGVYANTSEASAKLGVTRWNVYWSIREGASLHNGLRFYAIDLIPTLDVFADEDIETYKLYLKREL